jgi:hypothetical protein
MKMKKIKMRAVKMALTQNQNEMINVVKVFCQFGAFVNILQFMFCRNRNLAFLQSSLFTMVSIF